jgi:hypothetical protein
LGVSAALGGPLPAKLEDNADLPGGGSSYVYS